MSLRSIRFALGVVLPLAIACNAPRATLGRTASGGLRETLVSIEREAWEAWKRKDAEFFRKTLLPNAAYVSAGGVNTRDELARQVESSSCRVEGYTLRSQEARSLSENVALLTLRATSDLTCGSRMIHSDAWVSTVFVHDGNEWRISFHQETDVPPRDR